MDLRTPRCDWCQLPLTGESPGVLVNNRWRFHEACIPLYRKHTLAVKLEKLPLYIETIDPNYGR